MRYLNPEQLLAAARSAIKPTLLITMACTLTGAVVIYGLFGMLATGGGAAIFWRFVGGAATLLWTLFGLTALARQLDLDMRGEPMPNTKGAMCFAWSRIRSLVMLPAWAVGALLALLIVEVLALLLARIPGLGLVWLALAGVPLLLLNTVVALGLLLALFNIAARVAISDADANALRDTLWRLLRERFAELAVYNLGGALATALIAAIVLSPVWLGLEITWGLAHIVAGPQVAAVLAASGFWGGIAHLVALVLAGALLAAVASVPGIVITHMTILVHRELDAAHAETAEAAPPEAPQQTQPEPRPEPAAADTPATESKPKPARARKAAATAGKTTRKRAASSASSRTRKRAPRKKTDDSPGDESGQKEENTEATP